MSGSNAYVSLPPGSVPGGVRAVIRDAAAGDSLAVQMVNGGFDPVAIAANIGDSLFVTVTRAGSAAPVTGFDRVGANGAPQVVRSSPARGAKDVALNATIVMVFSAPLDSTTIDTSSIQLLRGTTRVIGTVRFADTLHLRLEFHPESLLVPQTDYQLVATQAVRDANGVALDPAVGIPFTTGSTSPAANLVFATVSVGFIHSCGVTTTGAAYCWGDNYAGELGDGNQFINSGTPVAVAGGHAFASVSVGLYYSCGVTTAGRGYCWGQQAPSDSLVSSLIPQPISGGLTFASMSTAASRACGVTTEGAAYCWGDNGDGVLGVGSSLPHIYTPRAVSGGLTFASVSVGGDHICGVTTGGAAYCWGWNTLGELGTGTSTGPEQCESPSFGCSTIPVAVSGDLTFTTVSSGGAHTCGVATSGTPYCWGDNEYDVLGIGRDPNSAHPELTGPEECVDVGGVEEFADGTVPCSRVPWLVAGHLSSVSTGGLDRFACGLTSAGVAYCWGEGGFGESTTAPKAVQGGLTFKSLSAGLWSACGVTTGGVAYCWGANDYGELGDGTTTPSGTPVKVLGQP